LLVHGAGVDVERAAVTGGAVEAVVDALGDGEELGRTLDHHPADVDTGAARVSDQRLEQLRDTATPSSRVHVPNDPSGQHLASPHDALLESIEARRTQNRLESRGAHRRDLDFEHGYPVR
jgi:hypothetical protein